VTRQETHGINRIEGEQDAGIRRNVHDAGATTVLESVVDYTRKDGQVVTIPSASFLDRAQDGKVSELRVYIDLAPVFAQEPVTT